MRLSKRLQYLHDQYRGERSIWDIGCDHGFLGLSFQTNPLVKEIHLVDPSASVISNLKNSLDSYITNSQIFIHHQRGQKVILSSDSSLIFIAGMGGKEIQDILFALQDQLSSTSRVVISPHRNILELRQSLKDSHLRLESESVIKDGEQFYQCLILAKRENLPPVEAFGSQLWAGDVGKEYKNQQLKHFGQHQDELSRQYCLFLRGLNF